jgi:hypothetical protein
MIKNILLSILLTAITYLIVALNPVDINGKINIGILNFYEVNYIPNYSTVLLFIIGFLILIIFIKKGLE